MKVNCEIIQDLLPLYEEGICTPSSKAAVEKHLAECERCRKQKEGAELIAALDLPSDLCEKDIKAAGGFKRIRRKWFTSLISVLLILPLLWMTINQVWGQGICFTSIDDIMFAMDYVGALQEKDYDRAAEMYDFRYQYQDIQNALNRNSENYSPNGMPFTINGTTWYADSILIDYCKNYSDSEMIWKDLIYESGWTILITREVWLAYLENAGMSEDDYQLKGNKTFTPMETPWGTFMATTRGDTWEKRGELSAHDYVAYFNLLPETVYLNIQAELQADSDARYQYNADAYAEVAQMSETEFCEFMKIRYAAELETCFSNIEITDYHYRNSFLTSTTGGWQIDIRINGTSDGVPFAINLIPYTEKGGLRNMGGSYMEDDSIATTIFNAVYPGYIE